MTARRDAGPRGASNRRSSTPSRSSPPASRTSWAIRSTRSTSICSFSSATCASATTGADEGPARIRARGARRGRRGSTPSSTSFSARCGPAHAARTMVSINAVVRESLALPPAGNQGPRRHRAGGTRPTACRSIPANADQLKQAFYNLIKNAVQALTTAASCA